MEDPFTGARDDASLHELASSTTSPPPTPSFHDIPTQYDKNEEFGHHKHDGPSLKEKLWKAEAKGVEE